MMTTHGRMLMLATAALVMSGAPATRAEDQAKHGGFQHPLALSSDQAASWAQENEAYEARVASIRERRRELGGSIERAAAAADREELAQALLAAWDLDQENFAERRAHDARLKALLTPEQAEKLAVVHETVEAMHIRPGALEETLLGEGGHRPHHMGMDGEPIEHERGERKVRHRKSEQ
jgi:hypothetical protein